MHFLPTTAAIVAALFPILGLASSASPWLPDTPTMITAPSAHKAGQVSAQELLDATNNYRTAHGLQPLASKPELNNVAQDWSNQMAHSGSLAHRPNFSNSYPGGWHYASENVLRNNAGASAEDLINQWHNSEGHRKNMQNPHLTHMGVGIAYDNNGNPWATQNFAQY